MIRILAIAALLLGAVPSAAPASEGGGGLISLDKSIVIQMINFGLLLFILIKLLYKPLLAKMEERTQAIRKSLEEAQAARAEAERERSEHAAKLQAAYAEAQAIRAAALKEAGEEQRRLLEAARAEATRLVESARSELAQDVRRARQELRQEVADLATTVAERLIRKSLRDEDHRRIIEEAVGRDLEQVAAVYAGDARTHEVLTRPWIKPEDRRAVAAAIAQKAGARKLVQDFLGLVADRGRADHLPEIIGAYRLLVDAELGRARAQVRTAVAFTDGEKQHLATRLERALGKRIIVEEQVDSSLLGGFIAQVGSLILDGSLDGQLARMRQRLARG